MTGAPHASHDSEADPPALVVRRSSLVIFIDEIDVVRSLPFSTDEFFAAIRECYNRRVEEAEFEQVTFCLMGVATPSELIRDTRMTPFNIGTRIELNDFTEAEAALRNPWTGCARSCSSPPGHASATITCCS